MCKTSSNSSLCNLIHHLQSILKELLKVNYNKSARKRTQWMLLFLFILSHNEKQNSSMFFFWTSCTYMCMESAVKYLCCQIGTPVI